MLPIALLPVAGILLRFGQPDLLNIKYIADAGNAIFSNLAILFALGVAVGLSKDNNGTSALAALVGYLIMTTIATDFNKNINTGVLGGILIGILAASLYNRFKDIKLPDYLAFFGGKRFVPIITGIVSVGVGIILAHIWPPIQDGLNVFGRWLIVDAGAFGLLIYGVLNRILIITGLHHVINNLVWFVFGNYTNSSGVVVHGDIARFMAGDPTAGSFMSGFFPIMMFGLPSACFAMYKNALPENKKRVAGLLFSMALTSFFTGITEPIEFSFMFLAPVLYGIHAILTGLSLSIMYLLNVHLGFTFSGGFIDYILFFKLAKNPLYLLPVGILFALLYYFIFDFFIRKYNLKTIGRELIINTERNFEGSKPQSRAMQFIEALGGATNIIQVDSCMTRLRLTMNDSSNIDELALKNLGSHGNIAPTKQALQVIVGTNAELIASEIREALTIENQAVEAINNISKSKSQNRFLDKDINENMLNLASSILSALGGKINIKSLNLVAITRIRVEVISQDKILIDRFSDMKDIVLIDISPIIKQIYIGKDAEYIYQACVHAN